MYRNILGLVFFVAGIGFAMYGTALRARMLQDVNRHLPSDHQLVWLGWHSPKYWRLNREYRRLCPEGRHLRTFRITTIGLAGCLLAAALFWGFFG